ncbi:alpha/beta hydrolase [Cystobacter ferrugineus]|nr:alpha/beta hydrolase [Cystobacter ferrugineus]
MGTLSTLSTLIGASLGTAVRRMKQGPLRPGWSFAYEATVAVMKASNERLYLRPAPEQRAEMERMARPTPASRRVHREEVSAGGVPSVWFSPPERSSNAVVLYLHGGSYVMGSTRTHGDLLARLALGTGLRVLAPDYRLAPEHPFPAQLEDTLAVYRWLLSTGVPPRRVVFAGDSAGGGLALSALVAARDQGTPLPAGAVVIAPWVDLECGGASVERNAAYDWGDKAMLLHWAGWFLGGASAREPLASPLHADLRGLPPLFVHVGSAEIQYDDGVRITEKARAHGVQTHLEVWPEMVHDFQIFGEGFPESVRGTTKLCEHLQQVLSDTERQVRPGIEAATVKIPRETTP